MQIPAGLAGDRWGLKKVMMFMFVIAGFGMLGLGTLGNSYYLLLLFSALSGMGAGAYYPTCFVGTLFQVVSPSKRAFSAATIGIGMALGMLIGMTMSGPIYNSLGSYKAPFLILTIPTLLMVAIFHKMLPSIKDPNTPNLGDYLALFRDMDLWKINFATFTSL